MLTPGDGSRLRYVPALDGLRAVAVVGVMVFHGGVSWLPGGFLGVDVFFVLSGYLITTLLLREHAATGTIDLRRFWVRRLRRLLPALLLVVAAVAAVSPWAFDDAVRRGLRGDGLAALAYVANWRFVVAGQSYFAGVPSPLRHLWSLAVEEQWYLLFPPVVAWVTARRRPGRGDGAAVLLIGLVVAAGASTVAMAVLASGRPDPSRAYYGTDTRAHTLLVGAILAVVAHRWPLRGARRCLGIAGAAGVVGVVCAYLFVSEADAWMYRGGFLVVAVATAGLVAALALPDRPILGAGLLAAGPVVAVGRVSYGLYLWHWPVDVALTPGRLRLDGGGMEDVAVLIVRTAVTVALAVASYHLIEQPVRRHGLAGLRPRPPGVDRAPWVVGLGATGAVALVVVASGVGLPASVEVGPGAGDRAAGVPPLTGTTVPFEPGSVGSDGLTPVPDDRPLEVLVTGDSVAFSLVYGATGVPDGLTVRTRALVGCGLVPGLPLVVGRPDPIAEGCERWPGYWQQGADAAPPDVVLVAFGAWEVHDHVLDDGTTLEVGTPAMAEALRAALDDGVRAVLAVAPESRFAFLGAPCMRPEDTALGGEGTGSERRDPERLAWVNRQVSDYATSLGPRARYDDLGDLLCPDGDFRAEVDGVEVRPDGLHHAQEATGVTWRWLEPRLRELAGTAVAADELRVP